MPMTATRPQHWNRVNDLQHLTVEVNPQCGDMVRTACGQHGTVARRSANMSQCWLCRSLRAQGRA